MIAPQVAMVCDVIFQCPGLDLAVYNAVLHSPRSLEFHYPTGRLDERKR
jgi:hypothetical protein